MKGVTSAMVSVKDRGVVMKALVVVGGGGFREVEVEVEEEVVATAAFWAK
jgi:hypothetical protein